MLVIDDVLPSFSIPCEELRIEAPCYYRVKHELVGVISHISFWDFYKAPLVRVEPNSNDTF